MGRAMQTCLFVDGYFSLVWIQNLMKLGWLDLSAGAELTDSIGGADSWFDSDSDLATQYIGRHHILEKV